MPRSLTFAAALLAATVVGNADRAMAETTLTMSSWLPPTHPIAAKAMKPWAKEVRKVTDGRVKVRVLTKPLGSPLVHFDLAKDGVADITYGLHSYTKGERFVVSSVGQFPFMGDSAEALSVAYWQAAASNPAFAKEHEGTHVLALFTHGPGMLHNSVRSVAGKADMSGLKIRVPGGYGNDVVEGLGASPMLIATPELYESLSRGIADGLTIPSEAIVSFDLLKTVKYTTTFPGGLYNTTWFLVMNQAKWDSLSSEDQEAIMNVSGETFARMQGKVWDEADEAAWAKFDKAGIEVSEADAVFVDEVKAVAGPLEQDWAKKASARGVDGAALLEQIRSQATGQ